MDKRNLINYTDLEYFDSFSVKTDLKEIYERKNILILGDITYGTGNLITAQRLRKIFKDLGYNSFFYNTRFLLSGENNDYEKLKKFIFNKHISLIVGINVWRAGKIIHDIIHESNKNLIIKIRWSFKNS